MGRYTGWKPRGRRLFHSPEGQDDSITAAKVEDERRRGLRNRIASMFGDDVASSRTLIRDEVDSDVGSGPAVFSDLPSLSGEPARQQFAGEERDLTGALKSYYTTDLGKKYADAERSLRFGAANTGNVGSQTYADELSRINEENRMGGTSTAEAVRRSLQGLRSSREQVRGRAMGLVSEGTGEEGVRSATEGLRSASASAMAANKERLFDELFQNLAYTRVGQNDQTRSGRAQNYMRTYWPSKYSSGDLYGD